MEHWVKMGNSDFSLLSFNPTKWSKTFKQFVGYRRNIFLRLALKGLNMSAMKISYLTIHIEYTSFTRLYYTFNSTKTCSIIIST